ncbi:hypothetical protein [Methylobacterium sp. Leaf118]|uniref:hypothetical protein n=1 Tax=Methylobacterium sp. Leaf118 TaxID=2876562 RepID=UPI001E5AD5B1|nr:hypothetical protein [Methylobacterium sp. Leaf118]
MRHLLPILTALLGTAGAFAVAPACAQGYGRPPGPVAGGLPPDVPYRDPRPRFRLPLPGPALHAPAPSATFLVEGYQPRPTYQPMYNEPPQPLR